MFKFFRKRRCEARDPKDWPWGQRLGSYMIDPQGHVVGPLIDPEGWVRAIQACREAGLTIKYERVKE